jgi:1-aminocyclopropane-1-carboxylate deaminase/D-cysteine desulfhydrase-like pyridoxal-dependent ACC family enzyme
MSWSVTASGKIAEVKAELDRQFQFPLAKPPAGLSDEGERQTVRLISEMIAQCLDTFDPDKTVAVTANGHMDFQNWGRKAGACQTVSVAINPTR